jgi:hypothetical protein
MEEFPRVAFRGLFMDGDVTNWCQGIRDFFGVVPPSLQVGGGTLQPWVKICLFKGSWSFNSVNYFYDRVWGSKFNTICLKDCYILNMTKSLFEIKYWFRWEYEQILFNNRHVLQTFMEWITLSTIILFWPLPFYFGSCKEIWLIPYLFLWNYFRIFLW